jgi:Fe-S oxidoreductase
MGEPAKIRGSSGKLTEMAKAMVKDGNLNACLTCGSCASGCPATGIMDMDPRKFIRMAVLGMDKELERHDWVWVCTMCKRCYEVCPMSINIPELIYEVRARWPRDQRPDGIRKSCDLHVSSNGGAMGVPLEDFKFTVEDLIEECREQEGFENIEAPFDKEGAMFALNQNSREPVLEPEEMMPLWKILHTVGADWTYYSQMWGGENYCMFLADDENWEMIVRKQVDHLHKLGVKYFVNTECGHSFYAIYGAIRRFNIECKFEFISIITLYAKWIREGKLKVSSDWNKDLGIKFTVQDPCNIIRKSLRDEMAEDLRFVVKSVVGEENFIDMTPNRSLNYCCGGGGGAIQAGYTKEKREYGKIKFNQIENTSADYVITPCHNCHSQIHDLQHHFNGKYKTVHLWTFICLSMGILGEAERMYLGEDLAEFGL